MNNYKNLDGEEEDDEEINEEQIVQAILELGNDILNNIGVEEKIDDVGVFFSDMFYIQFFQAAFPEIDFSQLEEATNEEEMAENIQALIDLLGSQILKYDLSHISGKEIVQGNPEHCINLLQLVQEISLMMENKEEGGLSNQLMHGEGEEESENQASHSKNQRLQEDDEAQIIHERRKQQESNSKQNSRIVEQKAPSAQQSSQKRGRSYSDDRKPAFEMDDFADQLEMDMHNVDDDDEEDQEIQMMQQIQQQQQRIHDDDDDDEDEMDDNEEYDEEDIKMYNQLLANQQQQLAKGQASPPQQEDDDDEDQQQEEEDEDDNMEDLDPELVAAAQQMGLNPSQIRQLQQQLQSQGYGEEDDEDMQSYYSEGEMQTRIKLLKQKSYSAPYILISDCYDEPLYDNESQSVLQKACSTTMLQSLELKEQSGDQGEDQDEEEMDEQTFKLLQQQQQMLMQQQQQQQNSKITEASKSKESSSYVNNKQSKPQHVQNDHYHQEQQEKAQSVNQSKQSSQQKKPQQRQHVIDDDEEDDGIEINMAEKLKQLQEQQQQQYNDFDDDEQDDDNYGDEDDEQQQMQQQMMMQQQQQQMQGNQHQDDDEEDEEDEEDKTLIELDDLDDNDKEMLLQYLQQEYEKNPDQFPFPKELLQGNFKLQQQSHSQKEESIRDIKSEEMIVEDANQQQQQQYEQEDDDDEEDHQIMGGEEQIEEDQDQDDDQQVELTEEQQHQLQQLLMMQQQQMQQQEDYEGDEMHPQYVQMKPKKAKKGKSRPKSAGKKKTIRSHQNAENIDPNILQQMMMAQSHQAARPPKQAIKKRPSTGKSRKGVTSHPKLQPYQMPKLNVKVLQPSTPGTHFKSYTTNRSQTLSKKKKKKSAKKVPRQQIMQDEDMPEQVPMEMPVLSEDFLNQLSEEQLQALLEHQQQLMIMQQQQQMQQQMQQQQLQQQQLQQQPSIRKVSRPKSGKKTVPKMTVSTRANIYGAQPYGILQRKKSLTNTKTKKKKGKKPTNKLMQQQNGVFLNNFFPALEGGQTIGNGTQGSEDGSTFSKDQKYPKFSNENINNNPNYMELDQEAIDEVPPEEEGESQEHFKHNFYPQQLAQQQHMDQDQAQMLQQQMQMHQQMQQQEEEEDQDEMGDTDEQIELTEEQLAQLVQNAHNLTPEQQQQLQMILQEKMKGDMTSGRAQSYENIYSILMDNVKRAKDRLAHLGETDQRKDAEEETDRRILKQKMEFDALLNEYLHENKVKENRKAFEDDKIQKQFLREQKIQAIKEKKFEEDLVNQQKSLMYKRNAQQVRLCQKVYKLASELEKSKLLQEKKEFREVQSKKKVQKKMMIDAIETYYKDRIQMLKERIQNERFERKIAQQAQNQALAKMKRELNNQKKNEINKYLQLLKQEDQKYDLESTNIQKIENEIIKLYKK